MKTIYFHVGSGRCGSTAIQGVFNEPIMKQVFAHNSLQYIPEFYLDAGPLSPLKAFEEATWAPFIKKYFEPMLTSEHEGFFLTNENLMGVSYEATKENLYHNTQKLISYLAQGFNIKIIIVVRRQDTFIESLYNQLLKRGEQRAFSEFLEQFPRENHFWNKVADSYAEIFGHENIHIIPFEKQVIETSGLDDFFTGICRALGIQQSLNFSQLPTINPSLAPKVLELQQHANKILTKNEAHALSDWLEQNIAKHHSAPHNLLSEEQRKEMIDYYAENNRILFEKYIPDCSPNYYVTGSIV